MTDKDIRNNYQISKTFLDLIKDEQMERAVKDCAISFDKELGLWALSYAVTRAYFLGYQAAINTGKEGEQET